MSATNREDRRAISTMQRISTGSGIPASLRDASVGNKPAMASGAWKAEQPTPIMTPDRRQTRSSDLNPFRKDRFMSSPIVGNPNQGLRFGEPPTKRQRFIVSSQTGGSVSTRGSRSGHARGGSAVNAREMPALAPEEPDAVAIDVDSDVEDLGVVIPRQRSSPDPLNMTTPTHIGRPQKLPVDRPAAHPFATDSERVDGPSTAGYRRTIGSRKGKAPAKLPIECISDSDRDPISDFTDTPVPRPRSNGVPRPRTPPSLEAAVGLSVQQLAQLYGGAHATPRLDLRNTKDDTLRARMKPKQPGPSQFQRDHIATATTLNPPKPESPSPAKQKRKVPLMNKGRFCVPLKHYFPGTKSLQDISPDWHLFYEDLNHKITVKSGLPGVLSEYCDVLLPDRDVDSMEFLSPALAPEMDPIIRLKTGKPMPGKHHNATKLQEKYKGYLSFGSPAEDGFITFKIARENHAEYLRLLNWLKKEVGKHFQVDGPAAKSLWELVTNGVQMVKSRAPDVPNVRPGNKAHDGAVETLRRSARTSVTQAMHMDRSPSPPPRVRPKAKPAYKGAKSLLPLPEPSRRSSRQMASPAEIAISPTSDPDDLILVYPPSGTGAVNITKADINRLRPGEYLNDTLIEFGLKLWLNDLREKDPAFADQIHVFSSFFYKKLQHRNEEEGYQSVKKWTSKFDLFQKKYLIVPINENLHWYLAIICQPEYVLSRPTPPQGASPSFLTRSRKRVSDAARSPEVLAACPMSGSAHHRSSLSNIGDIDRSEELSNDTHSQTQEAEIEDELLHFNSSCSISGAGGSNHDRSPSSNTRKSSDGAGVLKLEGKHTNAEATTSASTADSDMEVDDIPCPASGRVSPTASETAAGPRVDAVVSSSMGPSTVPPAQFYGPSLGEGKQKPVQPQPVTKPYESEDNLLDLDDDNEAPVIAGADKFDASKTYIFTLDSLSSRHTAVIRRLSRYLKKEALDKKGLENTSDPDGKDALVPSQPNGCDCGIYLLHFAKTFMQDPHKYCRLILNQGRRSAAEKSQREVDWESSLIVSFREELQARIESLSEVWKMERAAKEEQRKSEGRDVERTETPASDTDIEYVDAAPATAKSPQKAKARRIR